MSATDLKSSLGTIADLFTNWLEYVRHPLQTCERLLTPGEAEQVRINRALQIWATAFVVSALVLTPLYHSVGIAYSNIGFHVSVFFFLTLVLFLASGAVHVGLRKFGIPSDFDDTVLIYSVTVGSYSPLLNLAYYPALALVFASLKRAKSQGAGLADTLVSVQTAILAQSPLIEGIIAVANLLAVLASLVLVGVFAEAAAQHYAAKRQKVLSAMSFSVTVLGIVPILIASLLYYYVIFLFES